MVLVAIVVMAAIIGGAALVNRMQNGSLTCLPSDFPKYPGATVTGETNYLGTVSAPGDTHECRMTFESNDDVSTVTGFYAAQMDVGEWMITANDTGNGVMQVRLRSRPATVGQIQFAGLGRHTQIQVKLDS